MCLADLRRGWRQQLSMAHDVSRGDRRLLNEKRSISGDIGSISVRDNWNVWPLFPSCGIAPTAELTD